MSGLLKFVLSTGFSFHTYLRTIGYNFAPPPAIKNGPSYRTGDAFSSSRFSAILQEKGDLIKGPQEKPSICFQVA